jgi:hypothetical protein
MTPRDDRKPVDGYLRTDGLAQRSRGIPLILGWMVAGCLEAVVLPAVATAAVPIEGHVGIFGVPPVFSNITSIGMDVELAWKGTPWGVGALAWHEVYLGDPRGFDPRLKGRTAWVRGSLPVEGLVVMAGVNEFNDSRACAGFCEPESQFGALLAISYTFRTERLWLTLTPQYVMPIDGRPSASSLYRSGIPWAEAGVMMTPWLALGVRFSETPLKVMVVF